MPETETREFPTALPIGAVYALATAETREWWRAWGSIEFSGIDFANHRRIVEVPLAEKKLRELLALPRADRIALGRALLSNRGHAP